MAELIDCDERQGQVFEVFRSRQRGRVVKAPR